MSFDEITFGKMLSCQKSLRVTERLNIQGGYIKKILMKFFFTFNVGVVPYCESDANFLGCYFVAKVPPFISSGTCLHKGTKNDKIRRKEEILEESKINWHYLSYST